MANFQNDQAAGLRRLMATPKPRVLSILTASSAQHQPRLITNLAASICGNGSDVLIMHASQTSREISYGVDKLPALLDVALGEQSLMNAISVSSHGFSVAKLMQKNQFNARLDSAVSLNLDTIFDDLASQYEIVLVDATLNKQDVLPLNVLNNSEILIQLTRSSESIKDAYTLIKQICSELGRRSFGIIVDNATEEQAKIVFRNISEVAKNFMQIELEFFGAIPSDDHLSRANKLGRSVIDAFPLAAASTAFKQIAQRLDYKQSSTGNIKQASYI